MIIFSYLTDFSDFPLKYKLEYCSTWLQVTNGDFESGCRWFNLFFIDFQVFYFIARIIPGKRRGF